MSSDLPELGLTFPTRVAARLSGDAIGGDILIVDADDVANRSTLTAP